MTRVICYISDSNAIVTCQRPGNKMKCFCCDVQIPINAKASVRDKYPISDKYIGVCTLQRICDDYTGFIEHILDQLDPDEEDPPCPIKCDHRLNPNTELQKPLDLCNHFGDIDCCPFNNQCPVVKFCIKYYDHVDKLLKERNNAAMNERKWILDDLILKFDNMNDDQFLAHMVSLRKVVPNDY